MATRVTSSTETAAQPARRGFTLWHLSLALVVIALLVTGYMTYTKLSGGSLVCVEAGPIDCSKVESSAWASLKLPGIEIPTAGLGFIAHLIIGAMLLLERRVQFFRNNAPLLLLGFTLFCALYHSYLIYISFFVIKAVCPWCLTAASIMYGQLVIAGVRSKRILTT